MEVIRRVNEQLTWEKVKEALLTGKAEKVLKVGDQITVQHEDLGKVLFDVLDHNREELEPGTRKNSITLQMHTLLEPERYAKQIKKGCNDWETSEIRERINRRSFIMGFEEQFIELLTPAYKKNDEKRKTLDTFFLLSTEEMAEDGTRYALYENKANMIKTDQYGNGQTYWTRTACNKNGYELYYVYASGNINAGLHAKKKYRYAPACVIAQ